MSNVYTVLMAVVLHGLLWQFREARLYAWAEKLFALLTGRPLNQTRRYDAEGIPIQLYRREGLKYNPLFVAAQAKRVYARVRDPKQKEYFIRLSDWLICNAEANDSTLWLPYRFDLAQFGLKAPWHSALAQGVALTVAAQRYELERDDLWLEHYRKLRNTLLPEHGLSVSLTEGSLWFAEYPTAKAPFVLNGMAAVLLELDTGYRLTGDELSRELFNRGFQALVAKLDEFDARGFSYYSLDGRKASRNYHQMHIQQLKALNAIRPHPKLLHYARRWQRHDRLPVLVQLFFNPRPKRILAFLASFFLILGGLTLGKILLRSR